MRVPRRIKTLRRLALLWKNATGSSNHHTGSIMLYCQLITCELPIILDHYGSFWDRCLLVSNVSTCHKYWINILISETRSLACPVRVCIYIYIKYWSVWYHPKWMLPKMGCAHGFGILHVKKRQTRQETTNFPVLARSIRALPCSIPNCSRGYPRLELQPWNTDLIQSVWWYYIYIYIRTCERYDKETKHIQ